MHRPRSHFVYNCLDGAAWWQVAWAPAALSPPPQPSALSMLSRRSPIDLRKLGSSGGGRLRNAASASDDSVHDCAEVFAVPGVVGGGIVAGDDVVDEQAAPLLFNVTAEGVVEEGAYHHYQICVAKHSHAHDITIILKSLPGVWLSVSSRRCHLRRRALLTPMQRAQARTSGVMRTCTAPRR
jgi:hypothetical protein